MLETAWRRVLTNLLLQLIYYLSYSLQSRTDTRALSQKVILEFSY
jgi:hypothetical protein